MSINLHIVTPARNMLSTVCDDVVLPGFDGEMDVLTDHAHFINALGAGVVKINKGGSTQKVAIRGGVVEIGNNEVTVLADDAVFAEEVNRAKLETEQKEVADQLLAVSDSETERKKTFEKQSWILAQKDLIESK